MGIVVAVVVVVGGLLFFALRTAAKEPGTPSPFPQNKTLREIAKSIAEREQAPDVALVLAIIKVESDWQPDAINPERPGDPTDDSLGLMQIKFSTANDVGSFRSGEWPGLVTRTELLTPETNILYGVRFIRWLWLNGVRLQTIDAYNVGLHGRMNLGRENPVYRGRVLAERDRILAAGDV